MLKEWSGRGDVNTAPTWRSKVIPARSMRDHAVCRLSGRCPKSRSSVRKILPSRPLDDGLIFCARGNRRHHLMPTALNARTTGVAAFIIQEAHSRLRLDQHRRGAGINAESVVAPFPQAPFPRAGRDRLPLASPPHGI